MTLEFQPYFQPDRNRDRESLAALNQTVSGIGDTAMQSRQQKIQNQRQQQMMQWQKAEEDRKAAAFGPLSAGSMDAAGSPTESSSWTGSPLDVGRQSWATMPNHLEAAPPSGNYGGGTPSAAPSPSGGTYGPQPQAPQSYPQVADAGTPDTGYPAHQRQLGEPWHQPGTDLTSHFLAAKAQNFSPYNHPDMGGTAQPGQGNPMASMNWDQFSKMNAPQREGYKLFADEKRKETEDQMRYGTGAKGDYYSPDQVRALAPGSRAEKIIKAYGGGNVPKDALHQLMGGVRLDVTQGEHADQFSDKRLTALGDALDPSKARAGAFGVSKQVYDRAERLESLASAYKDGNLDSRQVEELAIGLTAMLSGANTGAAQQVKSLVPNTIWGNAQKVKEWLVNEPQGLQQQQFVSRMLGSISREKSTASDQIKRTQFQRIGRYADLEQKNPDGFSNALQSAGIDPQEYQQWKKGGYKPMSAVQTTDSGQGGGGQPQTVQRKGKDGQTYTYTLNPQTGQYE